MTRDTKRTHTHTQKKKSARKKIGFLFVPRRSARCGRPAFSKVLPAICAPRPRSSCRQRRASRRRREAHPRGSRDEPVYVGAGINSKRRSTWTQCPVGVCRPSPKEQSGIRDVPYMHVKSHDTGSWTSSGFNGHGACGLARSQAHPAMEKPCRSTWCKDASHGSSSITQPRVCIWAVCTFRVLVGRPTLQSQPACIK